MNRGATARLMPILSSRGRREPVVLSTRLRGLKLNWCHDSELLAELRKLEGANRLISISLNCDSTHTDQIREMILFADAGRDINLSASRCAAPGNRCEIFGVELTINAPA